MIYIYIYNYHTKPKLMEEKNKLYNEEYERIIPKIAYYLIGRGIRPIFKNKRELFSTAGKDNKIDIFSTL